jgi:glycosyltransferase involved in cell wall biosynthesis
VITPISSPRHFGSPIGLSVVVPCYNEELVIPALVSRLIAVCEENFLANYEILLVNDGSSDRTWPLICEYSSKFDYVVGVNLSRNHGHQLALTAGLNVCRGALVFVIDADLQDPPELLPRMVEKIEQGFDVVYGQRGVRHGESLFKRTSASVFYRILDHLIDIPIPRDTGDFRLMTRRVVDVLNSMPERARFIRGIVSWIGFNQTGIAYERDKRFAGESHYPLGKMISLAIDGITGFSTAPLRLASHFGMVFGVAGFAMLGWVALSFMRHGTVTGWASIMALILVMGSVQLFILGVIGEYIGRMYMESKQRPQFVIQEIRRIKVDRQYVDLPLVAMPDFELNRS